MDELTRIDRKLQSDPRLGVNLFCRARHSLETNCGSTAGADAAGATDREADQRRRAWEGRLVKYHLRGTSQRTTVAGQTSLRHTLQTIRTRICNFVLLGLTWHLTYTFRTSHIFYT
jgi:hypothetical protein